LGSAAFAYFDLDTLLGRGYHPGVKRSRTLSGMSDVVVRVRECRACIPLLVALAVLCGASPSAPAQAAAPAKPDTTHLVVSGDVQNPLDLSLKDLSALPRTTLKVMNEHSGKEETYQGVPLVEILKRAGVPQGEQLRGPALATYVRANAADGYSVIFSLGELDSSIEDSDALVADTLDGGPIPEKQGPLRLVFPHDKRPARWVRMLQSLTVVKAPK
jgi:DMSO/TMAO reductase YedYZ molybdopterin-dependent catalytic subunit